jgi:transcriptional regulator with XRE-family HTH domain
MAKKHDQPPVIPPRPASLGTLGRLLRKTREQRGMTLDQLAAATGISKPYLSNIEPATAPGPASEEKLRRVARALELPEDQLLAAADWLRTPASVRKMIRARSQEDLPRRSDGAIDLDAAVEKKIAQARPHRLHSGNPAAHRPLDQPRHRRQAW